VDGACSSHGGKRNEYRVLVRKPKGRKPVGISRRRLEDNIKMDRREVGWGSMDRIDLALGKDYWRALVNKVMNLRVA
jgi:hypothetical protein